MVDPHSRESRGFAFVDMQNVTAADEAISNLNGTTVSGRALSVEKAKRNRPRTPTPGKYFGPPKVRRGRSRYDDRYHDRRDFRGGSRYDRGGRYDDPYRLPPRYDDRDRFDRYRGDFRGSRYDDRGRYESRYPPRDYRDRYDRSDRGDRGDRRYSRDDRMPPREDRAPPRDDRDRYAGPPPASESFRDREDRY